MATHPALFGTLHTKLYSALRNRYSYLSIFLPASLILLLLFPRTVLFFLPLVLSTSLCFVAAHKFQASEREAAKEVVLVCNDKAEVGLMQVYGEVNRSTYGRHVEAGCFLYKSGGGLTKSGVGDGGESVVFAGRLAAAGGAEGALDEEFALLKVDRLAEGVWNSYFGTCSRWNCTGDGCDVEENNVF